MSNLNVSKNENSNSIEPSFHGDVFPAGTRFTDLKLPKQPAAQGEAQKKFQGTTPEGSLKSFEKGGRVLSSPSTEKEKFKAFAQKYNQTLQAGEKAMKAAPNSDESISRYGEFNRKVLDTIGAAEKLGMSKENISKLQKDLFKPLIGESSPLLKGSSTEQTPLVANRYGFESVARRLNAEKQMIGGLIQRIGISSDIKS